MRTSFLATFFLFCFLATAQAGRKTQTVDYSHFEIGAYPKPIPWDYEQSQTCPFDDYDLKSLAIYTYYYYPDIYWTAKSGYEEWGWTHQETRFWMQKEAYEYYKAENPGYDDPRDADGNEL